MRQQLEQHRAELEALCRRYGVLRLELFGSAAAGVENPRDLDFLVEFSALPPGGYADAYFGLLDALQHLFDMPVELVVPSAVHNPYFLRSIEKTRTLLYAS